MRLNIDPHAARILGDPFETQSPLPRDPDSIFADERSPGTRHRSRFSRTSTVSPNRERRPIEDTPRSFASSNEEEERSGRSLVSGVDHNVKSQVGWVWDNPLAGAIEDTKQALAAASARRKTVPVNFPHSDLDHGLGLLQGNDGRRKSKGPYVEVAQDHDLPYSASPPPPWGSTTIHEDDDEPPYRGRTFSPMDSPSRYSASTHGQSRIANPASIWVPRGHYISLILFTLSLFSTIFSGIFLFVAIASPRYHFMKDTGLLSYASVSTAIALFARFIEASFATCFIAFVGQVVSRRAFVKDTFGFSMAELQMRSWILQPLTMLTQFRALRYVMTSMIGLLSLLAALSVILYTTASNALVMPQLNLGVYSSTVLQGLVQTPFANPDYIKAKCQTPLASDIADLQDACLETSYASQSYNSFQYYLASWADVDDNNLNASDYTQRPQGTAMLHNNVSVSGQWFNPVDMVDASFQAERIINNVSLAMPHPGVASAGADSINDILQPQGTRGLGVYSLRASVPSPSINVLCANMTESELAPLVYNTWPQAQQPPNLQAWPTQISNGTTFNETVVDEIFDFGPGLNQRRPPIFAIYPQEYQTLFNASGGNDKRDSVYLLAKGGMEVGGGYMLCAMRVSQSPLCHTEYNITSSAAAMRATCQESNDPLAYIASDPQALLEAPAFGWPPLAAIWGDVLALNAGMINQTTSLTRELTQFIPLGPFLNPSLPSIAEALAVLAGNVLIQAADMAPFVETWDYAGDTLYPGMYQSFNASIRTQQYASGPVETFQLIFYPVLAALFLGNLFVLVWICAHRGLVIDFSDPANLFSMSINSPPEDDFSHACGVEGPNSRQYQTRWFVHTDGQRLLLASGDSYSHAEKLSGRSKADAAAPMGLIYDRLSKATAAL